MRDLLERLIGIGRATLVDDAGELQLIQVTEGAIGRGFADRVIDKVRRVSEFGFASVPPIDSEVLMLHRGGDRSRSLVVGTSHRPSRPRGMKPGEVGIYDVRGAKVMLTESGLVIDCAGLPAVVQNATTVTIKASEKVVFDTPVAEFTGAVTATGEVTALQGDDAAALGELRDAYNGHKHTLVRAGTDSSGPTDKAV